MRWLRLGMLEEISPLGMLVAGVALGTIGVPAVRSGLRSLTVALIKSALNISEGVREAGEKVGQTWSELVKEVRAERENRCTPGECLREAGRGVIRTGVELADQVKEKVSGIKEGIRELVDEARQGMTEAVETATEAGTAGAAREANNETEPPTHYR
ncbi:MAG TPA: hypothetical protein GXX25_13500 [Desulfotomaculum sp.]|nr:hypothetical protein [Desulfotomaculum sp.]